MNQSSVWMIVAGVLLGIVLGIWFAAYQGYQTQGADLRRVRRRHPRWFDSDIEYPPDEDDRSDGIVRGPFKPLLQVDPSIISDEGTGDTE